MAAEGESSQPASEESPLLEAPSAGGKTPDDLVDWFQSTILDYDATFIIYYRGLW
jgi:hypothetical protein